MYKNILVSTDGSELSERAIGHAVELAKEAKAKLTAVTVTAPLQFVAIEGMVYPEDPERYKQVTLAQAEAMLDVASNAARAQGVECERVIVEAGQPFDGIISTAKEKGCDLIVMASHGRRGISALILGSETQKVLTHSTIPVLVYR
jgi:nucleotide-binding universal stress UspA family protein